MRLLLTTDYYWPHLGGGVEVVVQQLAERLARRGHSVAVVTLNTTPAPQAETFHGVEIFRLPAIDLTRWVGLQLTVPVHPFGVRSIIRKWQPDVIHSHNRFFVTSFLATLAGTPSPTVFTLHLGPVNLGLGVALYESTVSKRVLRAADCVTAVSPLAAQVWPRATVIPNGVDTDLFRPAPAAPEGFDVMCVGRLIQNKGPERLLEALPLMENSITLTFVGDGPLRPKLEQRAHALGVTGRVAFLGTRADVHRLLQSGSVLVRDSDTEGMSLSVLEAMACGLPVIGSPAACASLVGHAVHGFQLRDHSPQEIAGYVNQLFRHPDQRHEMAQRARLRSEEFSWDRAADAYEIVYEQVMGRLRVA